MPDASREAALATVRVKRWNDLYENNRTRELKRMDWVPVPNRMDGDGYTELVDHPDGASHLGAWLAIVQIASRCDPRGTLLRDHTKPHTPQSLARISRLPAELFEQVIPRLIQIGWLEFVDANPHYHNTLHDVAEIPQHPAIPPHRHAASLRGSAYGREVEGKELKCGVIPFSRKPSTQQPEGLLKAFDTFLSEYPNKIGVDEACRQWISLIDIGTITEATLPEVLAGLARYKASEQWVTEDGKYISAPARWLREAKWRDHPKSAETYNQLPPSSAGIDPYREWIPPWKTELDEKEKDTA